MEQIRVLPPLPAPEDIVQAPNGFYTISCPDKASKISADAGIHPKVWFQTPPLNISTIQRIHSMQLHAESHDQGWCSEPDSGNWTWFEFAIMEREVDLLAQNMPLQEEGWGENGDEGQDAEVLEPEEAPAADEAPTNGDVDVAPTNGDVDAAPTNGDVAVDSDAPAVPVTDAAPTNGEVDVVVNNGESVVPVTVEATGGEEVPLTKGEFVDDQAEDDGGLSEDGDWPEYTRDSPPARVKQGIELVFCSHKNWRKDDLKFRPNAGKKFFKNDDIFRLVEEGNVIAVRIVAQFGAWSISARNGYLVIELGDPYELKPLGYQGVVERIEGVQTVFEDVNNLMFPKSMQVSRPPASMYSADNMAGRHEPPLRVLSLDGGGVRGVAALMILGAVMEKYHPGKDPWEVFDMIAGTSTGGMIAIMLGRFKMSIKECLDQYRSVMDVVFPHKSLLAKGFDLIVHGAKWSSAPLEKAIKDLTEEKLGDREAALMDENSKKDPCKVFVVAVNKAGSEPTRLRSYLPSGEKPTLPNIKLWQAARATSAAPSYFEPMNVGTYSFVDGGLQANNPMGWLWNEMLSVYGATRPLSCFLSIGTGSSPGSKLDDPRRFLHFMGDLAGITTNTEVTNVLFRSLINSFSTETGRTKYWRFNVGDGLPHWEVENGRGSWKLRGKTEDGKFGSLDNTDAIPHTIEVAERYIKTKEAREMIAECAEAIRRVDQL